ncbi:MAG: hypothetical protein KY476_14400, partial [Planctomycetes bacterium]|nr:hypothetical protein [Planctomycetota bacterium]
MVRPDAPVLKSIPAALERWMLRRDRTFWFGVTAGWYLLSWTFGWVAEFGASPPACFGLALALALGLELGARSKRHLRSAPSGSLPYQGGVRGGDAGDVLLDSSPADPPLPPLSKGGKLVGSRWTIGTHVTLAGWTVALPWLAALVHSLFSRVPLSAMEEAGRPTILLALAAVWLLLIPAAALGRCMAAALAGYWTTSFRRPARGPLPTGSLERRNSRLFFGLGLGLVSGAMLAAPLIGTYGAGLVAAACSVLAVGCSFWLRAAHHGFDNTEDETGAACEP